MIGRIVGTLVEKQPPKILIDVGGVGYEVDVPMSTLYNLPAVGQKVTLLTQLIVREDAHLLYGFGTGSERDAFRQLLRISGVGARTALAVLSGLTVAELAEAVTLQETARLTRIPGVGKKTAERLLLELKGKLGADIPITTASGVVRPAASGTDVLQALLSLGYNEREALGAIKLLPEGLGVTDEATRAQHIDQITLFRRYAD